jgi:adenylate kinase|tara:strand:- start:84 stop:692 length:609 start_codon:yes stop_codon:yes gene_type:complete
MKLIFIGPQGSGKGTQAKIISKVLGIAHISTGDLIRNTEGDLKEEIDSYINKGNLIPDKLILKILSERLKKEDCKNGFILDGFPRNLKQAEDLNELVKIDKIIEIKISDEETVKRLSGRRNCNKCERIYNLKTSPKPKKDNMCDFCESILFQREDDYPEAIKKRLEIYHKETKPILKKYNTITIDGNPKIEKITKEILNKIK